MKGKAEAVAYGAATIVNAIATGRGAAVGVDLRTRASVEVTDDSGIIEGKIVSDPLEKPTLIERTVEMVLKFFNLEKKFGAKVDVWSNIPIGRGLKSSSAAGNAITLAALAALSKSLDDLAVIDLGIDAAVEANVTITGAFDDACASYFGGVVVTDNLKRRITKRFEADEDLSVLFYVPATKMYTSNSDSHRIQETAPLITAALQKALKGRYWAALSLNGLICSSALGLDPSIAVDALTAGAIAAGLSGTGPAVAAVVTDERIDSVRASWERYEGQILQTRVNNQKAQPLGDQNGRRHD